MKIKSHLLTLAVVSSLALSACSVGEPEGSTSTGVDPALSAAPASAAVAPGAPIEAAKPVLESIKLDVASLPVIDTCNIETLNSSPLSDGKLAVDAFSMYTVSGWLIDDAQKSDGGPLNLVITDIGSKSTWQVKDLTRTPRPDVAASRGGVAAFENAGFRGEIPAEALPPGKYNLAVVIGSEGQMSACGGGTVFEVTQ